MIVGHRNSPLPVARDAKAVREIARTPGDSSGFASENFARSYLEDHILCRRSPLPVRASDAA
jgi:hypothetical protein